MRQTTLPMMWEHARRWRGWQGYNSTVLKATFPVSNRHTHLLKDLVVSPDDSHFEH